MGRSFLHSMKLSIVFMIGLGQTNSRQKKSCSCELTPRAPAPRGTDSPTPPCWSLAQGRECCQQGVAQPDLARLPAETRCSGEWGYVGSGHASWKFRKEPSDGLACCVQSPGCFPQQGVESPQVAGFPLLCASQLLSW